MYADRGDSDVIAAVETTTTLAETTIDPEPEPNDLPAAPTTQALEVDAAPGSTPESTDAEPTVPPSSTPPAPPTDAELIGLVAAVPEGRITGSNRPQQIYEVDSYLQMEEFGVHIRSDRRVQPDRWPGVLRLDYPELV